MIGALIITMEEGNALEMGNENHEKKCLRGFFPP